MDIVYALPAATLGRRRSNACVFERMCGRAFFVRILLCDLFFGGHFLAGALH